MNKARFSVAIAAAALIATPAAAQQATPLQQYNDWGAYVAETSNGKVCYVLSQPTSTQPSGVNRDPIYFFVTSRPSQDVSNEISVIVGYPFREGGQATAEVGDSSFTLFTEDDGAWVENAAEERRLIQAMRGGSSMVVKGTSQRGTETTDTYSLMGVTAALNRIAQECQ